MRPTDQSVPRLAAGCKWQNHSEEQILLIPEGAIRLEGTGKRILDLCDGRRTFAQMVAELHFQHSNTDANRIREDAAVFLEQLQAKRVVDYE